MKKQNNKHVRKDSIYNGRNIYGERCIAKFVKLEKETAVDQYLAILADLEANHGQTIEYTIDCSCFTREEGIAFNDRMTKICELRTRMRGLPFATGNVTLPRFAG